MPTAPPSVDGVMGFLADSRVGAEGTDGCQHPCLRVKQVGPPDSFCHLLEVHQEHLDTGWSEETQLSELEQVQAQRTLLIGFPQLFLITPQAVF